MEPGFTKGSDKINSRKRILNWLIDLLETYNPIVKHLQLKTIQINSG